MKINATREDSKSLWFHFDSINREKAFPVRIGSTGHLFSSNTKYLLDSNNMKYMNPFDYHSFQYLIDGYGCLRYHNGITEVEQLVSPGHIFLMSHNMDFSFKFTSSKSWEWMWILVEGDLADRVIKSISLELRVWKMASDSQPIMSIRSLFQTILHSHITESQMILAGCKFLLGFKDAILADRLSAQDAMLEKSKQIVWRNIRRIDVESLAKYYGYSTKYFQKHFRLTAGVTPGAFVRDQKINYAKMLLNNLSKSISEVAYLSGFSDTSHLCRIFRKYVGQSPKEWRQLSYLRSLRRQ